MMQIFNKLFPCTKTKQDPVTPPHTPTDVAPVSITTPAAPTSSLTPSQPPAPKSEETRDEKCQRLVEEIRACCLQKGIGGIKGLSSLFRCMDSDFSKTVSVDEFVNGMVNYGVETSREDLQLLFAYFDEDGSGEVEFSEFLRELRPPMSPGRLAVINEAFDKLDVTGDGRLTVDDLKDVYRKHAENHPKFKAGEWTIDDVLRNFLASFEDPNDVNGEVRREEFINYYAGVSSVTEDDGYFDLMMRSTWGLPAKGRH